jgi:ribonuclease P protein component
LADGRGDFPQIKRILKPDDYRRVFNENTRSADKLFSVLARPNGLQHARLGLAISKKQCRRAVDRNRMKRLIRESFRLNQELLAGLDLVVLSRSCKRSLNNRDYFVSLSRHWQNLAVKCDQSSSS